jgi:2-polyprenyl-3-methyl-5-hydroxy-6-metoxy-1,4-benzoquinol methylase
MSGAGVGGEAGQAHRAPVTGDQGFYELLAPHYHAIFPLSAALATRVDALLDEAPQQSVLDLGSGGGLLAVHTAARAARVVAVDLNANMVAMGANLAKERGMPVIWRQGDMLSVAQSVGERFGVVVCVGNTLLHLPGVAGIADGLRGIAASVRPGGYVLIQTINVDRCLDRGSLEPPLKRVKSPEGEVVLRRRYSSVGDGLRFDTEVERAGAKHQFSMTMVPLVAKKLLELAGQAGLREARLYGDFAGQTWHRDAPATVLIARGQH